MTHKSIDYKISGTRFYINNNENIRDVCNIFNYTRSSLHRWVHQYKNNKNLTRKNRKSIV